MGKSARQSSPRVIQVALTWGTPGGGGASSRKRSSGRRRNGGASSRKRSSGRRRNGGASSPTGSSGWAPPLPGRPPRRAPPRRGGGGRLLGRAPHHYLQQHVRGGRADGTAVAVVPRVGQRAVLDAALDADAVAAEGVHVLEGGLRLHAPAAEAWGGGAGAGARGGA